jgi:hypothetical protein
LRGKEAPTAQTKSATPLALMAFAYALSFLGMKR